MKITDRLWIISNYNQDPTAVISRLTSPFLIFNQGEPSALPQQYRDKKEFRQAVHTGHNISDYLEFIVENYENLPDSIGLAKGNIFPRHITEDNFIRRQSLEGFVPLYSDESTFQYKSQRLMPWNLVAQQIAPGYYLEKANNWYTKHRKLGKRFPTLNDFFEYFFKREVPRYVLFVPGACMIVPAPHVRRWPIETYQRLYEAVTYEFFPVEAFHVERSMLYFFHFPRD
jgi:hypothetical protein